MLLHNNFSVTKYNCMKSNISRTTTDKNFIHYFYLLTLAKLKIFGTKIKISNVSVKLYIFNFFLLFSITISAQKYYTNTGITEFDGSKAAFEPIKAKNNSSISAINVSNGNIAALIKIKDFEFRLGLMQEHFNENYLESYKYPKSTFTGKY